MATTTAVSSNSTTTADAITAAATDPASSLGENAFLQLLTAQLQNQDPTQPVDNQQFVAQLAQFSTLEQMQNVSSNLNSLLLATKSASQIDTASLVGKNVTFNATGVDIVSGQPTPPLQASLSAPATVSVNIQDAAGRTVRTLSVGMQSAGAFSVPWDGCDASGNPLSPAHYTVAATARAADGSSVPVKMQSSGTVQGISFAPGGTQVVVGGSTINLTDVLGVTAQGITP